MRKRGKKSGKPKARSAGNTAIKAKENTLRQLSLVDKKISNDAMGSALVDFIHSFRDFFRSYFKIRYEYTYDELRTITGKKSISDSTKNKIMSLAEEISMAEYAHKDVSKDDLKRMISTFRSVLDDLVEGRIEDSKEQQKKNPISGISKNIKELGLRLVGIDLTKKRLRDIYSLIMQAESSAEKGRIEYSDYLYNRIMEKYRLIPSRDKETIFPLLQKLKSRIIMLDTESGLKKFDFALGNCHRLIDENKIEEAKKEYSKMQKAYDSMPEDKKKLLYSEMTKVFDKLKKNDSTGYLKEMESHISRIEEHIKNDKKEEAKKSYSKIMELYEKLPEDVKARYYDDLDLFYRKISGADAVSTKK